MTRSHVAFRSAANTGSRGGGGGAASARRAQEEATANNMWAREAGAISRVVYAQLGGLDDVTELELSYTIFL